MPGGEGTGHIALNTAAIFLSCTFPSSAILEKLVELFRMIFVLYVFG